MSYSTGQIWLIIGLLGAGTYLIRLSFLGLIGDRKMPDWVLRHLRYTPVAVLPALVAPLTVWPASTGGEPDAAHMIAAATALGVAYWRGNVLWGVFAGASALALLQTLA